MSLIIEDGTGVVDANSYVTVEESDIFQSLRGRNDWVQMDTDDKVTKLIEAADYLNGQYAWPQILDSDQTMAIPNMQLDVVPALIKKAQIMLAYSAKSGPLTGESSGPAVKSIREKLDGVGETETEYQEGSSTSSGVRTFPYIDSMVHPYTVNRTSSSLQVARRLVG